MDAAWGWGRGYGGRLRWQSRSSLVSRICWCGALEREGVTTVSVDYSENLRLSDSLGELSGLS